MYLCQIKGKSTQYKDILQVCSLSLAILLCASVSNGMEVDKVTDEVADEVADMVAHIVANMVS